MNARQPRPVDPLDRLQVIDRLTVGPVRMEARRITTPYRVETSDGQTTHELVTRWEEDVLDPAAPGDRNLALMIGAQVALNYGLFCREIVFVGDLDRHDRRWIEDVLAHTAREIFAIKFLGENPFLSDDVRGLDVGKPGSWSRAKVSFEGDDLPAGASPWAEAGPQRHAVLSSGGKDSLLTTGLLREAGHEVHAIFVNESGRHWFTALNAHRHMSATDPLTSRVWTNCDRVFSAMLKHLPFVRQDWHNVRADIYPIRLWTVAVFEFAALPILRKRGIAHLSIGSEFDTTVRGSTAGITHYHGLYDQSRWFDQAMTRYFRRKKWGVVQYSVLRWLSELLIQKVLVERYPELQEHQVSCHAAHKDEETGRVRPCGKCEKCRRIVSMLKALDADPARCGYGPEDVERAMREFRTRGVHQEGPGVAQLELLLVSRGLLEGEGPRNPHPEILQLRFDPEKSPPETVPRPLRTRLLALLADHAQGAVRRSGREWHEVDLASDEIGAAPHAFEGELGTAVSRDDDPPTVLWADLTWPEAQERLQEIDVALLPVGAIEQHGPHLPLDVDAYDAERLAREVAERCTFPRPLVLPLIPYGVSYHHEDFAGTVSVGPDILSSLVIEIGKEVARQGIDKLVIINGHGGNGPALHFAAQVINRDTRIFTCVDTGETSDADVDAMTETPNDVHAGEIETSTTLALRPEAVRGGLVAPEVPRFSSHYLDFSSNRGVGWYARTSRISESGVMGDPSRASAEKGERMWELIVNNLVEMVEDLKAMSLEEIHQRRY